MIYVEQYGMISTDGMKIESFMVKVNELRFEDNWWGGELIVCVSKII